MAKFSFQHHDLDPEGQTYVLTPEEAYDPDAAAAITEWCEEQFGPSSYTKGGRWCGSHSYWFRDEQDALLFRLRWS